MSLQSSLSITFLGDIIGKSGRQAVRSYLSDTDEQAQLVVANVENVSHGFGITSSNLQELKDAGIKVFTGGNHIFDRKEIFAFIDSEPELLRPANYPEGTPGRGYCFVEISGITVAIVNLMGRVFMEPLQSPFLAADQLLSFISAKAKIILVDMHAEATAEKVAMGLYLDGRVSAVLGTHTHVQTADERILPGGTAYLTDAGCCGPLDGVIGMDRAGVFRRMINQLPTRLEVAAGPSMVNGVHLTIDCSTGKATSIRRIQYRQPE